MQTCRQYARRRLQTCLVAVTSGLAVNRSQAGVRATLAGFARLLRSVSTCRIIKDLFDFQTKEPSGPESELQAWIKFAGLNGVDRLPGYVEGIGQLGLRPVAFGAQHFQSILHEYCRVPYRSDPEYVRVMSTTRCQTLA